MAVQRVRSERGVEAYWRRYAERPSEGRTKLSASFNILLSMHTLILVRHGETDWNRTGQVMGDQPIPLNANGRLQIQQLAAVLKGRTIQAIITSPVLRALQTADILAESIGMKVVQAAGLREIGVGEWVNRYWNDIGDDPARRLYYAKPLDTRPPGGETLNEVQQRAVADVQGALAANPSGSLLFVSHGDVIRTIVAHYLHINIITLRHAQINNASVTALEVTADGANLLCLNHTTGLVGLP